MAAAAATGRSWRTQEDTRHEETGCDVGIELEAPLVAGERDGDVTGRLQTAS